MIDLLINHKIGMYVLDICLDNDELASIVRRVVSPNLGILRIANTRFPVYQNHYEYEPAQGDTLLSIHYDRKLENAFLMNYKYALNLHPGLLPYGRGRHPAFWALYNNEPAGATLHTIVEELDKGEIVAQQEVELDYENDTGFTAYNKVLEAERSIINLSRLLLIAKGADLMTTTVDYSKGSNHREKDIYDVKRLDSSKKAIRCLTFPGYCIGGDLRH